MAKLMPKNSFDTFRGYLPARYFEGDQMILRLTSLIRKEFIQILRDPRTLIVIIVMPIAMLFLLGYAANTDVKNLPLRFGIRVVRRLPKICWMHFVRQIISR